MDEFDDIENLYNDMLNEFSENPDDKIWGRLENNLNIEDVGIENWYKNIVSNFDEQPHDEVWEELSLKFDTENVWNRLLSSLKRRDRIVWWWQFSTGSMILLLAGFILFKTGSFDYQSTNVPEKSLATQKIDRSTENEIAETKHVINTTPNESLSSEKIQESESQEITPVYSSHHENNSTYYTSNSASKSTNSTSEGTLPTNIEKETNSIPPSTKDKTVSDVAETTNEVTTVLTKSSLSDDNSSLANNTFERIPPVLLNNRLSPDLALPKDNLVQEKNIPEPKDCFYIKASLVNPWLVNSDTYYSFKANSNDYNEMLISGGFGIGYVHWLKNIGIEADLSFDRKGHNYMIYSEGKSYQKQIDLDYLDLSVKVKKWIGKDNLKSWKSYISGGFYYGRTIHQNLTYNGLPFQNFGDYSKNDAGFIVSFERTPGINKKLGFEISLSEGIINIYQGNKYLAFNKTYNFALTASIKYKLFKK